MPLGFYCMYYHKKRKKGKSTSLSTQIRKLDRQFSRYIRLRDALPNGCFRCISCGQFKNIVKADCGHYHSRTHMSVRFDEDNAHAECTFCNRFKADHLIGYRKNLIGKIGEERVNLLDVKAHQTKKWSAFELEQLTTYYKNEADRLAKEKGIRI